MTSPLTECATGARGQFTDGTMSAIQRTFASALATLPANKRRPAVARLFLRAVRNWQRNRAINELLQFDNRH